MGSRIKNALTRKIGPLPAWGWLALVAAAVWYYRYRQGGASSTAASTTTDAGSNVTPQAPVTLAPGESVYDPNTGALSTAPAGSGDGSGGTGSGTSGDSGVGTAVDTSTGSGDASEPAGGNTGPTGPGKPGRPPHRGTNHHGRSNKMIGVKKGIHRPIQKMTRSKNVRKRLAGAVRKSNGGRTKPQQHVSKDKLIRPRNVKAHASAAAGVRQRPVTPTRQTHPTVQQRPAATHPAAKPPPHPSNTKPVTRPPRKRK